MNEDTMVNEYLWLSIDIYSLSIDIYKDLYKEL